MINKYRGAAMMVAPFNRDMKKIKIKLEKPCPYIGAQPGEMEIIEEVGRQAIEDGYATEIKAKKKSTKKDG